MQRNYGKVYVKENTTDSGGKEATNLKLLESVTFCNVDNKWYTPDGTLSPLFEKYTGRPYYVQFKMNLKDKNGKPVEFEGRIKMTYKVGQLPPQDFESVPTEEQRMIEWMKSVNMLSSDLANDDGYRIVKQVQGAAMATCLAPGAKICDLWALHLQMAPLWIMDDYIDSGAACQSISYKKSQSYWTEICELLEGKRNQKDVETFVKLNKYPDQYWKFVLQVAELRRYVSEKNEKEAEPLIKVFNEWYEAANLENCLEWKKKEANPNSSMYRPTEIELRLLRCGGTWTLECVLFDRGIFIPQKLRESFLFKTLVRAWCQQASLVNDIVSLKMEMEEGTTSNKVFLYHFHEGLEMDKALEKAIVEVNRWTDIVLETGELVAELFDEFEETRKFVDVVYGLTNGIVQWHVITTRYHKNLIFDCVVESE